MYFYYKYISLKILSSPLSSIYFYPQMNRWWVWCADEMSFLIINLFTNPDNQTINTAVHSWVSSTGGHTAPHLSSLQSTLTGEILEVKRVWRRRSPGSVGTLPRARGPVRSGRCRDSVRVRVFVHATQDQSRIQTWRDAICCSVKQGMFGRWNVEKEHYCFDVED